MKAMPRCPNPPLEAVVKKCQLMYQVGYFARNEAVWLREDSGIVKGLME